MSDLRVTDEAVGAAERAYETFGAGMRDALEAALPHLAPQPLTDEEIDEQAATAQRNIQRWVTIKDDDDDDTPWPSGLSADNPFLTPAPQPPTREQIAEALHAHDQKRSLIPRTWAKASDLTKHDYLVYADSVLALLNGSQANG